MTRNRESGFTLMEMMVVVAILAILATLAIVYIRPDTKPQDVAHRLANLVKQANGTAIRYGAVREDVALAVGSKRRTRIVSTGTTFTAELFVEDAAPATTGTWSTIAEVSVKSPNVVEAYAKTVSTYAAASLETSWSTFEIDCYPNGSCDAATMFISSSRGPTYERQARISVLPLGGAPFVRNAWE